MHADGASATKAKDTTCHVVVSHKHRKKMQFRTTHPFSHEELTEFIKNQSRRTVVLLSCVEKREGTGYTVELAHLHFDNAVWTTIVAFARTTRATVLHFWVSKDDDATSVEFRDTPPIFSVIAWRHAEDNKFVAADVTISVAALQE